MCRGCVIRVQPAVGGTHYDVPEEGGMNNKRVEGRPWGDVCGKWWDNFAKMCVYAWQTGWLSGGDVGRLCECSIQMGKAHLVLPWPKLLWSHLWIDHVYFFALKWRILSKFSCFALEGSHRRLKRMLRNSGCLSLLRGRLGVMQGGGGLLSSGTRPCPRPLPSLPSGPT